VNYHASKAFQEGLNFVLPPHFGKKKDQIGALSLFAIVLL
jgi:hypothetical protein